MTPTQYAILGYAVSFTLLIGYALWQWMQYRQLTCREERRSRS